MAWDRDTNIVGENDLKEQTEKALQNIRLAIEAAGGRMEDIVMLRIYKVSLTDEDNPIIAQALIKAFGRGDPPASF